MALNSLLAGRWQPHFFLTRTTARCGTGVLDPMELQMIGNPTAVWALIVDEAVVGAGIGELRAGDRR